MKKKVIFLVALCFILCCAGLVACQPKGEIATEYEIVGDFSHENKVINIKQNIKYTNNEKVELNEIMLSFSPNAFSNEQLLPVEGVEIAKAYPKGVSLAKNYFSKVEINDDAQSYEFMGVGKNIMKLPLSAPLKKGNSLDIFFEYSLGLPYNTLRFGYNDDSVNFANFYPQVAVFDKKWHVYDYYANGDPFYNEMANYKVELRYDKSLKMLSSGKCTEENSKDNIKSSKIEGKNIRDFAVVFSENASVISKKFDGVEVKYLSVSDKTPEKTLQIAGESLSYFSKTFGAYEYDTFNVCEVDFLYGGMEFTNLIYITKNLDDFNMQRVVSHETAHQWWYSTVGNNQIEDAWQDEALTEFSTVMYFNDTNKQNYAKKTIAEARENYSFFCNFLKDNGIEVDKSMNRALSDFNNSMEYTVMVYNKGLLMYENLYNLLGDKVFKEKCAKYYDTYKFKLAPASAAIEIFSVSKKLSYASVISSWLDGSAVVAGIA